MNTGTVIHTGCGCMSCRSGKTRHGTGRHGMNWIDRWENWDRQKHSRYGGWWVLLEMAVGIPLATGLGWGIARLLGLA